MTKTVKVSSHHKVTTIRDESGRIVKKEVEVQQRCT